MRLSCLIIDDCDHFKKTARRLLEAEGVAVVGVASTTAEALHLYAEFRPDVVLVDRGEESGFDPAGKLADTATGDPPRVIMISTYDEQDVAEMAAASPAIAFLSKPNPSARAISEILGQAHYGA